MKLILTVFILIFQISFLSAEPGFNFNYYDITNEEKTFMLCTDVDPGKEYTSTLVISTISDSKLIEVIDIKETGHVGSCFNFDYSKFMDLIGSQKSRYVLILESNSESNKDENRKENYVEFTIKEFAPGTPQAISYQTSNGNFLKIINDLTEAFLTEENGIQECTVNKEHKLCHTNKFTSGGTSIRLCGNHESGLMRCQTEKDIEITKSKCKDSNLITELEFNIDENTVKTTSDSTIDIIFQDDFLCFDVENYECKVSIEYETNLNYYGTDRAGACELISAYVTPMHFLDVEIALEVSWSKHPHVSLYDLGVTETNSPPREGETHTTIDCTLIPEDGNCEGYIFETPKAYKFDLKELEGKTKLVQVYEPNKEQEITDEITTKTPEYMIHTTEGQLEVCYSDDTGKKGTLTVTNTTDNLQINVPSESSTLTQCVKFDFKDRIELEVISRYNILFAGNEFSHKEYLYDNIIQIEKLEIIEKEYNILKLNLNKDLPSTNILYIEDEKIYKTDCGLPDSKEANRCYQIPLDINEYKAMCATENVDGTLICKEQEPTEPEKMDPQADILHKSTLLMAEPYTITTQFEEAKNGDLLILTTTNEKPEEYINNTCTGNCDLSSNPLDYDTIKIMAITNTNEGKNYYHVEKFYHTEMNSLYVQESVIETNWLLQNFEIETNKMYTISLDGEESKINCTAIDYNSICYGFHFGVEPGNKPSEITLTPAENKITSISLTAE